MLGLALAKKLKRLGSLKTELYQKVQAGVTIKFEVGSQFE